jgi:hypothetical protein
MKACKNCGLSIGDTATFCPVCCALVDPTDVEPATTPATQPATSAVTASPTTSDPPDPPASTEEAPDATPTAAGLEAEAHDCEKTDPWRAAALYRQAIVQYLDAGEDPLDSKSVARDVQRAFDRLSLVLKRAGHPDEALEEIEAAAYLGLLDGEGRGTKAQREALTKRREALRRTVAKT